MNENSARARARIFIVILSAIALLLISSYTVFSLADSPYLTANAASSPFSEGDGSDANPYILSSPDDLTALSSLVNGATKRDDGKMFSSLSYRLGSDINMSGVPFSPIGKKGVSSSLGFFIDVTPIVLNDSMLQSLWSSAGYNAAFYVLSGGEYVKCSDTAEYAEFNETHFSSTTFYYYYEFETAFFGVFDGNNHTISDLTINGTDGPIGLFGYAVNAEIKNLTVETASVSGSCDAGVIAGEISSSVITDCAVISSSATADTVFSAGGVTAVLAESINYAAPMTAEYSYDAIEPYLIPYFNSPRTQTVSRCAVIGGSFSSDGYVGGVSGKTTEGTVYDCFSSATVSGNGAKGCLSGSLGAASVATRCLGVTDALFGETDESSAFSHCLYPSDVVSDGAVPCELTTENILLLSPEELSLDGWNTFSSSGTTYYYPSPVSFAKQSVTAYSVTIDGTRAALVNSLARGGAKFVLPANSREGYDFAYYSVGGERKTVGETISLSSDVTITVYRTLVAPDSSDIAVGEVLGNATYSGAAFTAASVTYSDPYHRDFSCQWYKLSPDGVTFAAFGEPSADLTLTHVSESGSYFCRITITAANDVNLASSDAVYCDTAIFPIAVVPKTATADISASFDEQTAVPYTGNDYSVVYSAALSGVLESDKDSASVSFILTLGESAASAVNAAGSYFVSATVSHPDYYFTVNGSSFTVNPASVSAVVSGYNGYYDAAPHSVSVSDVSVVAGNEFTVTYSVDGVNYSTVNPAFTSVADTTVYVKITAPNHNDFISSANIVVSALPVTVSAAENYPSITKIYDSTTAFPSSVVTTSHYTLTFPTEFDGNCPLSVSSVTASNQNSGNVTVTVQFALDDGNFILSNSSIVLSAVILQGTISIEPDKSLSAIYRGGTDYIGAVSDEDYSIISNSPVSPLITVISATANSARVNEASYLSVHFAISGTNFVFYNGSGVYSFDFNLSPKKLTVDEAFLYAVNRDYDGTVNVSVCADNGALKGVIAGDNPSLAVSSARVSSPDASDEPKAVTIISANVDSDDYYIDVSEFANSLTVTIGKATPAVTASAASDRIYSSAKALPEISCTSSIGGVIEWKPLITDENGVIDVSSYTISESGKISFGYLFTPTDEVNYKVLEGSLELAFIEKAVSGIEVVYRGKTVFDAFEKVDVSAITAYAVYNDGQKVSLTFGADGFIVIYHDERNAFFAGDEYFTVSYSSSDGGFSQNVAVTVNKIVLPVPSNAPSYVYNGKQRTFIPSHYDSELMTLSGNIQTDVGNYVTRIDLTSSALVNYRFDNAFVIYAEAAWSITPLKKYSPFLERTSYVYSGTPINAVVRNDNNSSSEFFTVTGATQATDVGEYTLTIAFIDNNYYWSETDDSDPLVFSWKILPLIVTPPVIYDLPFTYDGSSHLVITDTDSSYILSGDLEWTNAGSYSVYANLVDDKNYVWDNGTAETVTLNYSVAKKTVVKPVLTTQFSYSGRAYSLNLNGTSGYTVSGTTRAVNVGNYTATISLSDENNYVWSDGESAPLVVQWRISPIYVALPVLAGTSRYTGSEQEALITADRVYCAVSGNSATVVGSYSATVSLTDKRNTLWADGTTDDVVVNWKINPAIAEIPSAPENALYNGLTQTASMPYDSSYGVSGNTQKESGSYTITASLNDKENYVWSDGTTADKIYEWKICRVTLSSDGENSSLEAYVPGTPLASPYKDGYTFEGWYLTSDYSGERVLSLSAIDDDTTLYAKWKKVETASSDGSDKASVLSEKAIIGIALGGGAFVLALLIVILGIIMKRGSGFGKKGPRNPHDIM